MLVIRRKEGESFIIGDDIEIKIVALENGTVQIGIDAPKEIEILRKELYKEVETENKKAMDFDLEMLKNIKLK
ncbi:carbon storage regulator CsrA [Clostridium thermobutyricum]